MATHAVFKEHDCICFTYDYKVELWYQFQADYERSEKLQRKYSACNKRDKESNSFI